MNYGPLEFAAHLRRKERDSATVAAARASVVAPRPEENRLTIISGPRELTRTRPDRAVTVFEAIVTRTATLPRVGKPVRVSIGESHLPVVLVLSSHQPVSWRLELASGARLLAVLLAGFGESRVSGAGDALITSMGGYYAFRRGSREFQHLEDEVLRATGCVIGRFENALAAGEFRVGND
jgi:hypothetical protein